MDVFRRYLIKSNPRQIQDTRSQKRLKTLWVLSSAGRASPLQGESRRFDPVSTHHSPKENSQKIQFKV